MSLGRTIKAGFGKIKIAGKLIATFGKCPKHKMYKGILYPRSECENCLAIYRTSRKAKPYKHRFKPEDVIIAKEGPWRHGPTLILGHHVFPNGQAAYRVRSVLPQHCLVDNAELWPNGDSYMQASYMDKEDRFKLLWRKRNG